ncbi:hypothetical protein E2C01_045196 [Portunus trituberculatus]|uniref:Uncharacterized protein n=1 Tax=Portunus trituberculatus TaxID=210409 RepID=A0A5B7FV35_PORTR|nr:hypothetical protein [Portunus trituberculatus]
MAAVQEAITCYVQSVMEWLEGDHETLSRGASLGTDEGAGRDEAPCGAKPMPSPQLPRGTGDENVVAEAEECVPVMKQPQGVRRRSRAHPRGPQDRRGDHRGQDQEAPSRNKRVDEGVEGVI